MSGFGFVSYTDLLSNFESNFANALDRRLPIDSPVQS